MALRDPFQVSTAVHPNYRSFWFRLSSTWTQLPKVCVDSSMHVSCGLVGPLAQAFRLGAAATSPLPESQSSTRRPTPLRPYSTMIMHYQNGGRERVATYTRANMSTLNPESHGVVGMDGSRNELFSRDNCLVDLQMCQTHLVIPKLRECLFCLEKPF